VGVEGLIAKNAAQLADFEAFAAGRQWNSFHHNHYDWWAFPIDERSSHGFAYTVFPAEVAQLRARPEFMAAIRRCAQLLALSWGWDLDAAAPVAAPEVRRGQAWAHWPVRLYKAARCMRLFGLDAEFASLRALAVGLMGKGEEFSFGRHDLSWLFTTGVRPGAGGGGAGGGGRHR
jgi:hypothetical protein